MAKDQEGKEKTMEKPPTLYCLSIHLCQCRSRCRLLRPGRRLSRAIHCHRSIRDRVVPIQPRSSGGASGCRYSILSMSKEPMANIGKQHADTIMRTFLPGPVHPCLFHSCHASLAKALAGHMAATKQNVASSQAWSLVLVTEAAPSFNVFIWASCLRLRQSLVLRGHLLREASLLRLVPSGAIQ